MTFQDIFKSSFLESFSSFSPDGYPAFFGGGIPHWFIYLLCISENIQRCPLQPQFQRIPHCHTAGDLSGDPGRNQQRGIVFGYGRCPVYCAFPYGSERPYGFGVFILGNWRRYPLRRFFAASGNSGMPYHRYFPAGILQPSAGRQPLPAHHPHGQRGRGKDSDNLCTAGSETDDSEVQDHYWRTGDRIDF